MKKDPTTTAAKLLLKKESVRQLTNEELAAVDGGTVSLIVATIAASVYVYALHKYYN